MAISPGQRQAVTRDSLLQCPPPIPGVRIVIVSVIETADRLISNLFDLVTKRRVVNLNSRDGTSV
jgi:hypothetical protein